ncbi:MAG: hypothetical protein ACRDY2_04100 [Acidimicrobiales bacterium]
MSRAGLEGLYARLEAVLRGGAGQHGSFRLDDSILDDRGSLDAALAGLAGWVASTLVQLGDLDLAFLTPRRRPALDRP